jgi:hypothetical protein
MPYSAKPFDYSLRSYDALDLSTETTDLLDVRDSQIEAYLRAETAAIQAETTSINTSITNLTNTVNGIIPAPGDWQTWSPILRRGSTTVSTDTTMAYYCYSNRIALFNCEIRVNGTTTWPGGEVISCLLPLTIRVATRVVGTAMFNVGTTYYQLTAFLPDTTTDTNEVRFISHNGGVWFGQNPSISGNRIGSNLYMNLICYPNV